MGKGKGWRKKGAGGQEATPPGEERAVSSTRQRKKEQVIHESVFESAVSLFRQNKLFCVKRDGEELFVGCYLPLVRIGGLSAADKNNETKGTMLNKINSGMISVLYTPTLASQDAIIIIPNKQTLEMLEELWSITEKMVMDFCFVDPTNEQIEMTDVHTNLTQLKGLHERNQSVGTVEGVAALIEDAVLPGEETLETVGGEDDEDEPPTDYLDMDAEPDESDDSDGLPDEGEPPEEPPEAADGDPFGDDVSGGETPPMDDAEEGPFVDEPYDGDMPFGDDGYAPEDGAGYGEEGDVEGELPDGDVDVPFEVMAVTLERRFFNEDLTRTLDTSGLDQSLAAVIPFNPLERRAGSWLDDQVNLLIDLANQELLALHQQNLTTVRQAYLDKMAEAYEREMGKVVTELEQDGRYAELEVRLDEQQMALPGMIRDERAKLEAEFESRMAEIGESARKSAETSYRERYRPLQEEKLRNVELEMRAAMDTSFRRAVADLKTARKNEASVKLDSLDSEAIAECSKQYEALARAEVALWEKHRDAIKAFLEEHREAEIARVRVLGEEHERSTKIEQVEAEYKARMESMQTEFDTRVAGLQSDMESMRARHEEETEARDKEYTRRVNEYRADNERQQSRIDQMLEDIGLKDERAREAVNQAVAEIAAERDATNARYDELVKHQRKGNLLVMAVAGLGVLAALLIGMFVGMATSDVFGQYLPGGDKAVETQASMDPVVTMPVEPVSPDAGQ